MRNKHSPESGSSFVMEIEAGIFNGCLLRPVASMIILPLRRETGQREGKCEKFANICDLRDAESGERRAFNEIFPR